LFFDSLALALDSNIILYAIRLKSWGFFLTTCASVVKLLNV